VLTSDGFFFAGELVEPSLERKANEATYVSHAPFTKWVMAASVYRKGDCFFFNRWVTLIPKVAFEGLEPREVKISCEVLRGLGVSNDPRLPNS